jgi:hypothetical protein
MVPQCIWRGRHPTQRQSGAPEDKLDCWYENGFGVAGTQLGGSPVLQRTSRADGVRMDFAWQVPYSQAVRSCTRDAWLMVREWIWCATVCDGSLELQRTGCADVVQVELAWQAPYP